MTEEELREKIAEVVLEIFGQKKIVVYNYVDQILTLIREAGWKSPEKVKELQEDLQYYIEKDAGIDI